MIVLTLRGALDVPLEAETVTPDAFAGQTLGAIERLPVLQGNRPGRLGDFFAVSGAPDDHIRVVGGAGRVKYLGKGMTCGRLEIEGDAGMHVGAEMRGGELVVGGNAGDWAGAEMRGGVLRIAGRAGHLLGAAYRGSPRGMRGGTIVVAGSAGHEAGAGMRRGLIAVGGDTGDFPGVSMLAGTIVVAGRLGIRAGAGMRRGTILTLEGSEVGAPGPLALLPTFVFDCEYRPAWIDVYLRELARLGFEASGAAGGRFRRYSGDLVELGKGEILAWTSG